MHKQYPTDLTDNEWEMIQHFFKKRPSRGGHPYIHSKRDIVDAIFYVLRSGCAWRLLPHDFPCWSTVYEHFRNWETQGVWEKINAKLVKKWREACGRKKSPSGAIIDSQSVRTTEKGVLAEDMMEQKRSKGERDISSLTRKGFCSRQKLRVLTLAIKKAQSHY